MTFPSFMFQDPNSPLMNHIIFFHDYIMILIIFIISLVGYVMFMSISSFFINRFFFENELLELLWTFIPMVVLAFLSLPSLYTLYLIDEVYSPCITIKTLGHQWFWSYEYSDFFFSFDSYMVDSSSLNLEMFRLLEVDNNLVIPTNQQIRLMVSSTDVIHSWTVPSLGIKVDAVPGRLNQLCLLSNRVGLMYGQCSEICGSYHSFMPICVEAIPTKKFIDWMNNLFN